MFRNYLAATLRNLARNKLYASINIAGLAIGFTAAILIAIFVRYEFNYDQFIPGYARVFRVSEIYNRPGATPLRVDSTLPNIAALMKVDFPSIESIARLQHDGVGLRVGAIESPETVVWADPDFFKVMPLQVVSGDPDVTLAQPDGIVLTRSMAKKYFGDGDPLGKIIELNRAQPMRVGAVIEDIPANSHLDIQVLASGLSSSSLLTRFDRENSTSDSSLTYFRVRNGTSIEAIRRGLREFVRRHGIKEMPNNSGPPLLELQVAFIADIHLLPAGLGSRKQPASETSLVAMLAIGVLIILVASINYVNLMTARAAKRSLEVGIRKAVGAERRDLVVQFIGESLIYVVIAMVMAIVCVEIILPRFNAFANTNISFAYWRDSTLLLAITALTSTVGVLAGLYPALVMSAFRPASVLKGTASGLATSGTVRGGLTVLQFAILIGIVLMTVTIYRQTRYALTETLRVPADQILLVRGCRSAFQAEIEALPGVQAAACDAMEFLTDTGAVLSDGREITLRQSPVDFGYLELFGLRPLAGRFFDAAHGADAVAVNAAETYQPNIVVNETAMHKLGFAKAADAVGKTVQWQRTRSRAAAQMVLLPAAPSTIIGVTADFTLQGVRDKIEPQIYFVDKTLLDTLSIKLSGDKIPESLAAIDRLWKTIGSEQPISRTFLDQQMQRQYREIVQQEIIFAMFSGLALLLACIGLYGLVAYTTERRIKEIGIRKAMGATISDIVRLLTWEFSKPVLWANLIAWPIAYLVANRWLNGFAYHIELSIWMFAAAGGIALATALGTVSGQAYMAARSRPIRALRYE